MADPMKGPEMTYTAGVPEDAKGLRAALINLISKGMNQGATPYSGPLGTQADQGQIAAMNMLMGMSGNGKYQLPSTYSMPQQPTLGYSGNRRTISGGGGAGSGSPVPGIPGVKTRIPPDPGGGDIPTPPFLPPVNNQNLFQLINAMRGMR